MIFINSPDVACKHPNSYVIASGGILFEIDKFEENAEFRQNLTKGKIVNITVNSFDAKFDDGYTITYPLPFKITEHKNLSLSEEDMYLYGFWKRAKKQRLVQLSLI